MKTAPRISVLTPTVRKEGLKLVEKALSRQTFQDFEWIVQERDEPLKKGQVWSLNQDYNKAIKRSKADLIVSWQDWTFARPDCLERFWSHFQREPKTLMGAVGNKYADDSWLVQTWADPRMTDKYGTLYECYWNDIEANLCSLPRQAIYDIGGFDEEMDAFFGLDFYNVSQRIHDLGGYNTKLDQSIRSFSLEHGRADKWDELNWIANDRYGRHIEQRKSAGKWPKLKYL